MILLIIYNVVNTSYTPRTISVLTMRGHNSLFGRYSVLASPQTGHRLCLRIEVQSTFSIEVAGSSSCYTSLVSCEGEHGKRHGDGDVDTHLARLDVLLEAGGSAAALCEDGNAIAVFVCVDELNGVIYSRDIDADQDRTENLLCVALHVWLYISDDSRADL